MNITEARNLLMNHSIVEGNYDGFCTVQSKEKYASAIFMPTAITTSEVKVARTVYNNKNLTRTVNQFVCKKVTFNADGTYTLSDAEYNLEISKLRESGRIGAIANRFRNNYEAKESNIARIDNLFGVKIDSSNSEYVSSESIVSKLTEVFGVRPVSARYDHQHSAPRFTVELTLDQMEALVAMKVGA
jgi:hypothetical protein